MRAVNLLPDPRTEKPADGRTRAQTTKTIALVAGAVLALVAALLGVTFVHARSDASSRQKTLDGLNAQVSSLQASAAATAAQASKSQTHLAAVTNAASGHVAWDGLLSELSRVMPRGAWLETLQANGASGTSTTSSSSSSSSSSTTSPSSTSTGSAVVTSNGLSSSSSSSSSSSTLSQSPTSFVLTGYALSQDVVAQALSRLALMPTLSDVALQSTERADVGNRNAIQFTIGATVRFAGGNG